VRAGLHPALCPRHGELCAAHSPGPGPAPTDAEVHIHGSMADCTRFMAGELHLAMAIARGDVS
jgi:hypothetical protein